ncbi:hypothetical protein [Streptomyces sp. NPDC001380]|uniref:hypothetical protein n=1 Tax=Streptomyces sp. NPDC001380 TaxID=3364566 RepID=UPI0036C20A4C
MSEVTIHAIRSEAEAAGPPPATAHRDALDHRPIGHLVDRAVAEDPDLGRAGGLLPQLVREIRGSALEGRLADRPGCEGHDPSGAGCRHWTTRGRAALNASGTAFGSRLSAGR